MHRLLAICLTQILDTQGGTLFLLSNSQIVNNSNYSKNKSNEIVKFPRSLTTVTCCWKSSRAVVLNLAQSATPVTQANQHVDCVWIKRRSFRVYNVTRRAKQSLTRYWCCRDTKNILRQQRQSGKTVFIHLLPDERIFTIWKLLLCLEASEFLWCTFIALFAVNIFD